MIIIKKSYHKEKAYNDVTPAYNKNPTEYNNKPTAYNNKLTAYNDGTTAYNDKPIAYNDGTTAYNDKSTTHNKYYHIRQLWRSIYQLSYSTSPLDTIATETILWAYIIDKVYKMSCMNIKYDIYFTCYNNLTLMIILYI